MSDCSSAAERAVSAIARVAPGHGAVPVQDWVTSVAPGSDLAWLRRTSVEERAAITAGIAALKHPMRRTFAGTARGSKERRLLLRLQEARNHQKPMSIDSGSLIARRAIGSAVQLASDVFPIELDFAEYGTIVKCHMGGPGSHAVVRDPEGLVDWLSEPHRNLRLPSYASAVSLVVCCEGSDRSSSVAAANRRLHAIGLDPRRNRHCFFDHGNHLHVLANTVDLEGGLYRVPFGVAWLLWAQDQVDRTRCGNELLPPLVARSELSRRAMGLIARRSTVARVGDALVDLGFEPTSERMATDPLAWHGVLAIPNAFSAIKSVISLAAAIRYCLRCG
jgi:hypothetical protein